LIRGDLLVVEADASLIADTFNLTRLAPETDGGVLVVESERGEYSATWNSLRPSGSVSEEITWSLPSSSVEVLGVWGEELLVQRANEIWLLNQDGGTRSVGGGQFLAFDGENLARLVCDEVSVCSLAVGPPSDPDARTVELPEWLEAGPDDLWVPTVVISPDGDRLAMAGPNGGISSPLIVDLETGIATPLADGINRQAAMAWSPDGRWLAYVYTDDVMVWSLDEGRSWRVTVDRQLETLLWR
jgi:WD40 repeat protein